MRTRRALLVFLLLCAAVAPAHAQSMVDAAAKAGGPPRFGGLGGQIWLYDASALNTVNYSNTLSVFLIPRWSVGRLLFRGSRWSSLTLSLRQTLNFAFAGNDEDNYRSGSDLGPPVPCSDLTPSTQGGQIDPTQVRRCDVAGGRLRGVIPNDMWVTVGTNNLFSLPGGIHVSPAVRFDLPTSIESQYQTQYLRLVGQVRLNKEFLGGKLSFMYLFQGAKHFHESTAPRFTNNNDITLRTQLAGNIGYSPADLTVPFVTTPGAVLNPSFGFLHLLSADINPVGKLDISFMYLMSNTFAYESSCKPITIQGITTDPCANANAVAMSSNGQGTSGRAHNDSHGVWISVGYPVLDWLTLSLSWINIVPLRKPDNSIRQPFYSWDYNAFTQINVGAIIAIDPILEKAFPRKAIKTAQVSLAPNRITEAK